MKKKLFISIVKNANRCWYFDRHGLFLDDTTMRDISKKTQDRQRWSKLFTDEQIEEGRIALANKWAKRHAKEEDIKYIQYGTPVPTAMIIPSQKTPFGLSVEEWWKI